MCGLEPLGCSLVLPRSCIVGCSGYPLANSAPNVPSGHPDNNHYQCSRIVAYDSKPVLVATLFWQVVAGTCGWQMRFCPLGSVDVKRCPLRFAVASSCLEVHTSANMQRMWTYPCGGVTQAQVALGPTRVHNACRSLRREGNK